MPLDGGTNENHACSKVRPRLLNQASIPGLKVLADALGDVLPEDHSRGDPSYLAKSALEIIEAGQFAVDASIARAAACARKYWGGADSETDRESLRLELLGQSKSAEARVGKESPEAARYALASWSLDIVTPSSGYASDYLLDFAIRAGVSVETLQPILERNIPGLTEALQARRGAQGTR